MALPAQGVPAALTLRGDCNQPTTTLGMSIPTRRNLGRLAWPATASHRGRRAGTGRSSWRVRLHRARSLARRCSSSIQQTDVDVGHRDAKPASSRTVTGVRFPKLDPARSPSRR